MNVAAINWDAVTAIGQAVGALGVIISLIYVGLQVRADARARRAQTTHDQAAAYTTLLMQTSTDPEVADLIARGSRDLGELTGDNELTRFSAIMAAHFRTFEDAFIQHRMGHLDDRVWVGFETPISFNLRNPGVRALWALSRGQSFFCKEFENFIDSRVAEGQGKPTSSLAASMQTTSNRAAQ